MTRLAHYPHCMRSPHPTPRNPSAQMQPPVHSSWRQWSQIGPTMLQVSLFTNTWAPATAHCSMTAYVSWYLVALNYPSTVQCRQRLIIFQREYLLLFLSYGKDALARWDLKTFLPFPTDYSWNNRYCGLLIFCDFPFPFHTQVADLTSCITKCKE